MSKQSKKFLYTVPAVHHVTFGCEIEVKASSQAEAKALVRAGEGELRNEAYDWDRMTLQRATVGTWDKITREEI